jgi:DNA-binding transcriptional regulator YhcF (GntR family)
MEAWAPQSVRELAQVAGIASTTVSAQLVRLEQDGLVQKVPLPGTRRTGYQVTERFFNIWFLMRHASRRIRQQLAWLVEFMRLWYSREEITGISERRASNHRQNVFDTPTQGEYARAIARTIQRHGEVRSAYARAQGIDPDDLYAWANDARLSALTGDIQEANTLYRKGLQLVSPWRARHGPASGTEVELQAHLWLGNGDLALQALERLAESAQKGDARSFGTLREQAFECHRIGIGLKLADLMAASAQHGFLLPLEVALRAAHEGTQEPIMGAPAETQAIALEVLRELGGSRPMP